VLAFAKPVSIFSRPPAGNETPMLDGFVETPAGRIHFLETEPASDRDGSVPLILLHSNGCSASIYDAVMPALARGRRVIAWDMPGHGDSDPHTRHRSVRDYADAVVALMDAHGIARADVLGSSIGGSICVALGAHHAARLRKLVIVEAPGRTADEARAQWPRTEKNFSVTTQTAEQLAPRFRAVTPAFLTRWNIDRNKAGVKAMIDVMWALREYDVVADLRRIAVPALIMFGDSGPNVGKAERFRQALPQAPLEIMKDCAHFPMIDDPEGFVARVNAFLDEPSQTMAESSIHETIEVAQ
jgi:3-oxoadipate enol-lactonase